MNTLIAFDGQNYMKMPYKLIVTAIFAEMKESLDVEAPVSRTNLFIHALTAAVEKAAKDGYGREKVIDGWTFVVMSDVITLIGRTFTQMAVGQFNIDTGEVVALPARMATMSADYQDVTNAVPSFVRAEMDGNQEMIDACCMAIVSARFVVFEDGSDVVSLDGGKGWVSFQPSTSGVSQGGVLVAWQHNQTYGGKFVPLPGLEF